MIIAKIEAVALELPDGSNAEDSNTVACFDFNACNDPMANIKEQYVYNGSLKRTIEGRIGQDLTSLTRQWDITWDLMTPEQYKALCDVLNLHCNKGHCIRFTILNSCDCNGCDVNNLDPVYGIIRLTGNFEYGKWFGSREDVSIRIEESAGGCGDCS